MLNGLMPCGPLQTMQLYALGTGSLFSGALSMAAFAAGTIPLMLAFALVAATLPRKVLPHLVRASAVLVLLLGAAGCVLPLHNSVRAGIGLASQAVAMALVLATVTPVLLGGSPLTAELAWAYPVGTLRVRLDALGAFFLAWSLPMTAQRAVGQAKISRGSNALPHRA